MSAWVAKSVRNLVLRPIRLRCAQCVLLEHAEGNGLVVANDDVTVVRRTSPHRLLRIAEPWADGEPEQLESFAPNIDAQLFLECEG